MGKNILVVADVRHGALRNVTKEMLGVANQLAGGGSVHVAVLGHQVDVPDLGAAGADEVWLVNDEHLANYTPSAYRKAVLEIYQKVNPQVILFAHSAVGKDLAPVVAMRLGLGQISDVTDVQFEGDKPLFTRPIYAGKAFTKVAPKGEPYVVTVRPNNLSPYDGAAKSATTHDVSLSFETPDLATVVREVVKKATGGVDLTEAKIIVSGGRGVKSADGFSPLKELADVLGAAVGASRGACDAGYCDYALQIGQTGKVVTPDLYIACGISGAIQHLAGMSSSKVIVAINKDPEAPIFQIADYGIVGDLFEVVPLLTEEFKKVLVS
ncbi:electron transfer flavoprotein subunit alpha/FixB family protein [Alicyclobacillus fastidiosus]|uniref:Electron transfer flavoprotein subunit alpha/FixB family protein n=1 Tax=Alicyclobacillus fastidiosus TaxID=392011 RepID=A0ABY6ZFF7_9BACL|nr:electron transfer flavoprotein subunit alpha/FixB family protein [Alicyclobacillus fastidiosus]WAH40826.1 electron transfer flavoprotein subunit alpha/FixB family protein [Alicyclobacillus fastidiosus]GMA62309.1 electron transfer flavoprotein subunit alpha [Alicyclobacillus fastidiosus]